MTTQSETSAPATQLAEELFAEFARVGSIRPRPECRELLVRTLNELVRFEPEKFFQHLTWLVGMRDGCLEGDLLERFLEIDETPLPRDLEKMLAKGFESGSDQVHVYTLVCPVRLTVIHGILNYGSVKKFLES